MYQRHLSDVQNDDAEICTFEDAIDNIVEEIDLNILRAQSFISQHSHITKCST